MEARRGCHRAGSTASVSTAALAAFAAAGQYDQPEPDPEQVLGKVGNPPPGLP